MHNPAQPGMQDIGEQLKQDMDAFTQDQLQKGGESFEAVQPRERILGVCHEGIRRVCTMMKLIEARGVLTKDSEGQQYLSFPNPTDSERYGILMVLVWELIEEEFLVRATIRKNWVAVIPRETSLH